MKNKINAKYLQAVIVVLIVGVILSRGLTYAKYVSNAVLNYYLNSKGFYFESDNLSINGNKKNTDTSWDGGSIYFNLKNSSNDALATDYDIEYKITCEIEEENTTKECRVNGTESNTLTAILSATESCTNHTDNGVDVSSYKEDQCNSNGYTWASTPTAANLYFDVIDTTGASVDTASVVITAKSTAPYEKTLSAKYLLTKDRSDIGTLSLTYEEKTNYNNLIVTNSYNEDKCLKLSWNSSDLTLDTTNIDMLEYQTDTNEYINEISFKMSKMDSKNYVFYQKDDEKSYTEEDFSLVEIECQ